MPASADDDQITSIFLRALNDAVHRVPILDVQDGASHPLLLRCFAGESPDFSGAVFGELLIRLFN
jgi:hypothetical protein